MLILFADGGDNIGRRQIAGREFVRVQPYPHCIITTAKHDDFTHARQAAQIVFDIEDDVIAQIEFVIAAVLGHQVDHQGQIGRLLLGRHADLAYFIGQTRQGSLHAVLHLALSEIRISADLEGYRQLQIAVGGRHRRHVEHVLDAVDLFFQGRGDGLGDNFGIGARISCDDHHRGWHDVWIFRNRQKGDGNEARKEHYCRQYARQDRAINERTGNIHGISPPPVLRLMLPMFLPWVS